MRAEASGSSGAADPLYLVPWICKLVTLRAAFAALCSTVGWAVHRFAKTTLVGIADARLAIFRRTIAITAATAGREIDTGVVLGAASLTVQACVAADARLTGEAVATIGSIGQRLIAAGVILAGDRIAEFGGTVIDTATTAIREIDTDVVVRAASFAIGAHLRADACLAGETGATIGAIGERLESADIAQTDAGVADVTGTIGIDTATAIGVVTGIASGATECPIRAARTTGIIRANLR